MFSAQYQQEPTPTDGNVLRRSWLRFYQTAPTDFDQIIASWDTASTLNEGSDWSVGQYGGPRVAITSCWMYIRDKLEFPVLARHIVSYIRIGIAPPPLLKKTELWARIVPRAAAERQAATILRQPRVDKRTRFAAQASRFEADKFIFQ